ncbi:phosphotransferase family protein [Paenibacillus brevis]|uniref:Aminoglycoside phosphotransferase family protein n=1 Tax=Paenibacillus brevis TaxID=2841508 RepID=A0ABS6FQL1_9BACL|nr:aminoglycoside phosphotransferase family protein [Paenibacillus brevis]MBU5672318.1 aminoglycoside phosphotransferase family protein [Paenibacillus brevis]
MKNALKRSLTPEELNQLTAQVFGADSEIFKTVELKDGWFNTAYDLLLKNGLHTVLKLAPLTGEGVMRYERNMMQTEVEVLKLLQQIDSIPVPEVYFAGKDPQGGECFLMKFISGLPLDKAKMQLTEPEMQAVRYELGTISQRINEIEGEQFGYFAAGGVRGPSWYEVFENMTQNLLLDARDKGIALPAHEGEICGAITVRRTSLEEVTVPKLVHWDLWDGNVFVDKGRVTGLIDCERALWGDPLMEFYFRELAGNQEAFLRRYGKTSFSPAERERLELYDLYLALIMHIECTYRGYEDENHHKWAAEQLAHVWGRVSRRSSS